MKEREKKTHRLSNQPNILQPAPSHPPRHHRIDPHPPLPQHRAHLHPTVTILPGKLPKPDHPAGIPNQLLQPLPRASRVPIPDRQKRHGTHLKHHSRKRNPLSLPLLFPFPLPVHHPSRSRTPPRPRTHTPQSLGSRHQHISSTKRPRIPLPQPLLKTPPVQHRILPVKLRKINLRQRSNSRARGQLAHQGAVAGAFLRGAVVFVFIFFIPVGMGLSRRGGGGFRGGDVGEEGEGGVGGARGGGVACEGGEGGRAAGDLAVGVGGGAAVVVVMLRDRGGEGGCVGGGWFAAVRFGRWRARLVAACAVLVAGDAVGAGGLAVALYVVVSNCLGSGQAGGEIPFASAGGTRCTRLLFSSAYGVAAGRPAWRRRHRPSPARRRMPRPRGSGLWTPSGEQRVGGFAPGKLDVSARNGPAGVFCPPNS